MNNEEKLSQTLPIAKLSGVIENKRGSGACSLVFALQVDHEAYDDPEAYRYLSWGETVINPDIREYMNKLHNIA